MASIDSQNYSPLLEKRNFKDLLEDDMVTTVEEDLITKIFSQTVQVSPSDESPEAYEDLQNGGGSGGSLKDSEEETATDILVVVDEVGDEEDHHQQEEEEEPIVPTAAYDKVPTNLAHFNQTIDDLGDPDDEEDFMQTEEETTSADDAESSLDGEAILAAANECVQEIMEELEHLQEENHVVRTPSTASPFEVEENHNNDEQSEIRDFEEIERITEVSPEKEQVSVLVEEENLDVIVVSSEDEVEVGEEDEDDEEDQVKESPTNELVTEEPAVVAEEKPATHTAIVADEVDCAPVESAEIENHAEYNQDNASLQESNQSKMMMMPRKEVVAPLVPTIGILYSVRELSKLYEEQQLISRPRRPFIKEDIMQINLNVKNMCRSFLDLTQYSAAAAAASSEGRSLGNSNSKPHHGSLDKKLVFQKSSFSKFDALQKKAAAAAAVAASQTSNGSSANVPGLLGQEQNSVRCTACDKVVYQMEQMKAENRFWHKNCFRCTTCNKPLAVDSYQSHESILYCKPHFKQLFSPKTVLDAEDTEITDKKGPEMIIRESQPTALPEGVVRATDKVEDGLTLDDLNRLKNVKHAFEMFEKQQTETDAKTEVTAHKVEKSPSIINKLAQFQKKISRESNRSRRKGVPADDLHGEPLEKNASDDSSSCYSSGDDEPPEGVDVDLWRSRRATNKSDPIQHCADLDDLKKKFEGNNAELERRERQEERREEIKRIRSRLFMGKQAKIKEQYQQAVAESEFEGQNGTRRGVDAVVGNIKDKMQQLGNDGTDPVVNTTKQKLLEMKSENLMELEELRRQKQRDNLEIKSKFESGLEKSPSYRAADDPELMAQMVEKGIAKMSRNIFLEIDKQAQQSGPKSPIMQPTPPTHNLRKSNSIVQSAEVVNKESNGHAENGADAAEVVIDTKDLQKKFAFFEKYQEQDRSPKKTINVTKFRDTATVKEMFENQQVQNNVRRQESHDDLVAVESNTTKKMLNLFRGIESGAANKQPENGPRPLKTFTPPPDGGRRLYDNGDGEANGGENGEEEEEDDSDPGVTDNSDIESEDEEALKKRIGKYDDEILERAKKEARAQKLRAKFERWEQEQIRMEQEASADQGRKEFLDPTQLESATNLREKFEFMAKGDLSQNNSPRKVVNRFV